MKVYYPPSSDDLPGVYQDDPDTKNELINFFHNGVLAAANVKFNLVQNNGGGNGPSLTSHQTAKYYYLDDKEVVAEHANLIELNQHGHQEGQYKYDQCSRYTKYGLSALKRAKMILRYELESGMVQLTDVLSPPQYTAAAPAVTPSRNAQGGTTNNDETAQNLKILTKNVMKIHDSVGGHLTSVAGQLAQITSGVGRNTEEIRYLKSKDEEKEQSIRHLKSKDAEKEQYIQEIRERVGKLELERSVGTPVQSKQHVSESTGSAPTPLPTPPTFSFGTASYAKPADVAAPGPATATATASSASNPAVVCNQSSVAFVKGQTAGYESGDGSIVDVTIVGVHVDDYLEPYYTIQMANGDEKQTVKERLFSTTTPTAPSILNAGFSTPQRQVPTGERSFSIGVSDKKKGKTEHRNYSERKKERKNTLFGSRKGRISSRSRPPRPSAAKQPSSANAHRAQKSIQFRRLNQSVLFPTTPQKSSRSATPSKPTPLPFNSFN
eukprot:CAMPEP_0113385380 /NCGR_PEP_ID=MMETSP0013_2-20120614/7432_1 /TAXON_ID=2843 ORGANISM="Skeletonema costatum, Strain 1716" /NCGR_SAMPLE_ID=MMETSP0013_2 /ASSEMBLY_ACC=CAM_ASM_000158 /LENGTH=493 /DNA_ID=CAMNT_0000268125 /DNA_START=239 /DNA_END=1720 /DNA_ORIENTATION=+ /assembly_acc=CAM_ASM_000158